MAEFVKPWADWTPEYADAVRIRLEANDFEPGEETTSMLRSLEGYQAERDASSAVERNASLFSKEGLRHQVRRLSPKGMEATEQGRPWYERLVQSARDAVTLPWRASLEVTGDIGNAVRIAKGSEPVEREVYSMDNASSVTHNDPMIPLSAYPGSLAMRGVMLGGKVAGAGAKALLGKVGPRAAKVGGAAGGLLGEAGVLAGEEYAGNLGDVSGEEALLAGVAGAGLGRGLSAAATGLGKGAQYFAKAKTRQKYNPTKTDVEKHDLTGRTFGGKELRETETLMLESGDMGRTPDAAEAITGKGSAWEGRVRDAYEAVAQNQRTRLGETIKSEDFRALAKEAGADPEVIDSRIASGRDAQEVVAVELNRADSAIRGLKRSVDSYYQMLGKLQKRIGSAKTAEARQALVEEYNALKAELQPIEAELKAKSAALDGAADMLEKSGTGVINRDAFAAEAKGEVQKLFKGVRDEQGNLVKGRGPKIDATKAGKATEAVDEINDLIDRDVKAVLETNSGRFIPMSEFRNQVRITTKTASQKRANDPLEASALEVGKEAMKTSKRRIDQEQSKGELGDAARSESLRFGIEQGLESIQPKVDNNNRMNVHGIEALFQRLPVYDRALTGLYRFGTKLAPRSEQGNIARQGLLLPENRGGEWQTPAQAILATAGRELPHLKDRDKLTPTAKAEAQIDLFLASIRAAKHGE